MTYPVLAGRRDGRFPGFRVMAQRACLPEASPQWLCLPDHSSVTVAGTAADLADQRFTAFPITLPLGGTVRSDHMAGRGGGQSRRAARPFNDRGGAVKPEKYDVSCVTEDAVRKCWTAILEMITWVTFESGFVTAQGRANKRSGWTTGHTIKIASGLDERSA